MTSTAYRRSRSTSLGEAMKIFTRAGIAISLSLLVFRPLGDDSLACAAKPLRGFSSITLQGREAVAPEHCLSISSIDQHTYSGDSSHQIEEPPTTQSRRKLPPDQSAATLVVSGMNL